MNKEARHYRDMLINAYKDGKLSTSNFINTLDHYTDLIKQAQNIRAQREMIAGMALQGLLSNSIYAETSMKGVAADALMATDALIKELNKEQ